MLKYIQKAYICKRHHGFRLSELQIVGQFFLIGSTNKRQPFLHLVLMDKFCTRSSTLCSKKLVEIKLIELPLHGDAANIFG